MIELCSQTDIDRFKNNNSYPPVFAEYLQARFSELKRAMAEFCDDEEDEFRLTEHGPLYILQKSDDLRSLTSAGFNACDNGVFGDIPEEVSLIETPEGFSCYEVQTAFNNSFLPHFQRFSQVRPQVTSYKLTQVTASLI